MAKISKRARAIAEKVEIGKAYAAEEAFALLSELSTVKFPETVDVTIRIGQGVACIIVWVASTPFKTGMTRSMRIRSGVSFLQQSTASWPFRATQTTLCSGAEASTCSRLFIHISRSLTMPISNARSFYLLFEVINQDGTCFITKAFL